MDGVDGTAMTCAELRRACELRPHTPPYVESPALEKMLRMEGTPTIAARPDGKWDFSRRLLTRGAVGCALSHLGLWERRAQADDPHTISVVLEDDARLCTGFEPRVGRLLAALGSGSMCADGEAGECGELGWDLCYLGRFPRPPGAGQVLGAPAADGVRHVVGSGVYGPNPHPHPHPHPSPNPSPNSRPNPNPNPIALTLTLTLTLTPILAITRTLSLAQTPTLTPTLTPTPTLTRRVRAVRVRAQSARRARAAQVASQGALRHLHPAALGADRLRARPAHRQRDARGCRAAARIRQPGAMRG